MSKSSKPANLHIKDLQSEEVKTDHTKTSGHKNMKEVRENAAKWLSSKNLDPESRKAIEVLQAAEDQSELTDAFYKDLEFGTGGLRGIMGIGSNRMNKYTLGMATQGLANYLKKKFPGEQIKVAIAHDSRNNSRNFADLTASVFSANGIKVYTFEGMRPTPELSFAIRHFGCHSGVMLTASHNPKEYNGYKAYWKDGAQLVSPDDVNVIAEVKAIEGIDDVKFDKNEALIETIGHEVDDLYLQKVRQIGLNSKEDNKRSGLKIVYSPLHGTGITMIPQLMEMSGFDQFHVVKEQAVEDGNFPTVIYPNPEEAEALTLALKLGKEVDADLILATDPDADRVGIAVKNLEGEFQLLNGNQTASMIFYFMLKKWQEEQSLNGKQFVVSTIVTSDILDRIAEHFEVECINTLTGFKHIAAVIRELENQKKYIVGGEESFGYLPGDYVRDKDGVASSMIIAEIAAFAKNQGQSLFELLIDIYQQFGFYKEKLISITKKGMEGALQIKQMMEDLRQNPPSQIAGEVVKYAYDYQNQVKTDLESGKQEKINLPKSNVLQFETKKGTKISARPSGTEPKIKFYMSVNEPLKNRNEFKATEAQLDKKIEQIVNEMNLKS